MAMHVRATESTATASASAGGSDGVQRGSAASVASADAASLSSLVASAARGETGSASVYGGPQAQPELSPPVQSAPTPEVFRIARAGVERELARAGLPASVLETGIAQLSEQQRQRLRAAPSLSHASADAVHRATRGAGRTLARRAAEGSVVARLGHALAAAEAPRSTYQAAALVSLVQRIDAGERSLELNQSFAVQNRDLEGPFIERYLSWEHDDVYMGDDYTPSGYRLHFCSDPSAAFADCDETLRAEVAYGPEEPNTGRRYYHLLPQQGELVAGQTYRVYATAFNTTDGVEQSSVPSAPVDFEAIAAHRGDLNRNGSFDWADVESLLERLETPERPWVLSDLDRDGDVDADDLDQLVSLVMAQ